MRTIELNDDDVVMLREILESYLGDLRMEIGSTDSMDFREGLKVREVFLKKLLSSLH